MHVSRIITGINVISSRVKQQEKMANYCKTIFGGALLTEPLDKYPVSEYTAAAQPAVKITDKV